MKQITFAILVILAFILSSAMIYANGYKAGKQMQFDYDDKVITEYIESL